MKKIYFIFLMLTVFACSNAGTDMDIVIPEDNATKAATSSKQNIVDWSFWLFTASDDPFQVTWEGDVIIEEDTGNHSVYAGNFHELQNEFLGNEFSIYGTLNQDDFVEAPFNFRIVNFRISFDMVTVGTNGVRLTFYNTDNTELYKVDVPKSEIKYEHWVNLPDLVLPLPDYPNVTSLDYGQYIEPTCEMTPY